MDIFQAAAFQDIDVSKIKLTDEFGNEIGMVESFSVEENGIEIVALLPSEGYITMRMPL